MIHIENHLIQLFVGDAILFKKMFKNSSNNTSICTGNSRTPTENYMG